jgi:hypothetical protein
MLACADMALLFEVMDFEADSTDKTLGAQAQAVYDSRHPAEPDDVQPQL